MKGPTGGPDDRLYSFGLYVADPVTGTLRRNGLPVPITLKSVEKDILLKLVWPDTIVEENNLARHISTLRKAWNQMILPIVEASGAIWVLENIER